MVNYVDDREYLTPDIAPPGTVIKAKIIEIEDLNNQFGLYHRLKMETNIKGKDLSASMNISDNVSMTNPHGLLVISIYGKEIIEQKAYTEVGQLKGREVTLKILGYNSKWNEEQGKTLHYPKFEPVTQSNPNNPPGNSYVSQPPITHDNPQNRVIGGPVAVEQDQSNCDNCNRPLPDKELIITQEDEQGEEYSFCSKKCKAQFFSPRASTNS